MAQDGKEPVSSMGTDIPLAVLSRRSQLLHNYFKQLFAQVTNPPIDPIREKIVMNTESLLGSEGNLLDETPEHARLLAAEVADPAPTPTWRRIRHGTQAGLPDAARCRCSSTGARARPGSRPRSIGSAPRPCWRWTRDSRS